MIEKILERLEAESDFFSGEPMGSLQKLYYCEGVKKAISIVQEVAKEYGKDTNVRSNADRIRAFSDEELAEFFAKFTTICEKCAFI